MTNQFYSPTYAGESILKAAVRMRTGLRNEVVIKYRKDIEKRTLEIIRINSLSFNELKAEFYA